MVDSFATEIDGKPVYSESYERSPFGSPTAISGDSTVWGRYQRNIGYSAMRLVSDQDSRMTSKSSFAYDDAGNLLSTPRMDLQVDGFSDRPPVVRSTEIPWT